MDNSGNLVGSMPGDDFVMTGTVTTAAYGTLTGVLLTGEINAFGYDVPGSRFAFDFEFTPTGGGLAPSSRASTSA